MKINWKVRLKNPVWWAQIVLAILTPILAYLGLTLQDLPHELVSQHFEEVAP